MHTSSWCHLPHLEHLDLSEQSDLDDIEDVLITNSYFSQNHGPGKVKET